MFTLLGGQVEVLWDEVLPIEARELPEDLAGLERVLRDPALLGPVREAWACSARDRGRPSIAIDVFMRLMVVKQRTGWGYETRQGAARDTLSRAGRTDRLDRGRGRHPSASAVNIQRHEFHGDWNYTITPTTPTLIKS